MIFKRKCGLACVNTSILQHNYNKIHLFFCLKMSSILLKSTLLMLGPSIAIFIKCSKFESERRLRRRVFMSFI